MKKYLFTPWKIYKIKYYDKNKIGDLDIGKKKVYPHILEYRRDPLSKFILQLSQQTKRQNGIL